MIVLTYVGDYTIDGPYMQKIDTFVKSMEIGPKIFTLTYDGDIDQFLGIVINHLDENIFQISHPFLIDRIISFLNIDTNDFGLGTNSKSTTMGKHLLHKELSGNPRKENLKYRTSVGMVTYLQGNSGPEMSMAVHQTACFSNNPMLSHAKALKCIGQYILHTKRDGIIYNPNSQKGLECYVDADFAGGLQQVDSSDDESIMSRTGMVIMYANCPIYWRSLLQTKIALSTA